MSILSKVIYRFNAVPIKTAKAFFKEIEKTMRKMFWYHKKPQISKEILRKKNKAGGILLLDFKLHYKVIVSKTSWYYHKTIHIYQWNTIGSSEINPHIYCQLIFHKGAYNRQWGKDSVVNKRWWENWIATHKREKLVPYLTPLTKINLK